MSGVWGLIPEKSFEYTHSIIGRSFPEIALVDDAWRAIEIDGEGWRITGAKTWSTHAGRADLLEEITRLTALRSKGARAAADVIPIGDHLRLTDTEFQLFLRHRLGLPLVDPSWPPRCPRCAPDHPQLNDPNAAHMRRACYGGYARTTPHECVKFALRDILIRAFSSKDVHTEKTVRHWKPGHAAYRADIQLIREAASAAIDVTIVDCQAPSHNNSGNRLQHALRQGHAAGLAFRDKNNKMTAELANSGMQIVPFVVESFGRLHSKSSSFLTKLNNHKLEEIVQPDPNFPLLSPSKLFFRDNYDPIGYAMRHIAVALARGLTRSLNNVLVAATRENRQHAIVA